MRFKGGNSKNVKGKNAGGGHRRVQMFSGGLFEHATVCDPLTLQDRAAAVDLACCPGDTCTGGVVTECSWNCAVEFVPFYEDCGATLASMGSDQSGVNELCTPARPAKVQKAVDAADCSNQILSCRKADLCVDSDDGGGATRAELADCENWTGAGGAGWTAGGEACEGVAGNLVANGGFESPSLAAVDCNGGHDSVFRGDDHCAYKYIYPTVSEACHSSCGADSWTMGGRDGVTDLWVAIAENGADSWMKLDSHMGKQFLILEGGGVYAEQRLTGLVRGQAYEWPGV